MNAYVTIALVSLGYAVLGILLCRQKGWTPVPLVLAVFVNGAIVSMMPMMMGALAGPDADQGSIVSVVFWVALIFGLFGFAFGMMMARKETPESTTEADSQEPQTQS